VNDGDGQSHVLKDTLSDNTTSDQQIHNAEIILRVEQALKTLSPRQKMVFSLKHYEGYKLREIADDMIAELIMGKNDYLGNIRRHLEVIYSYFDIAASQDWVSPVRINQIKDNYLLAAQKLTEMELAQEIIDGNSIKDEEEYRESEKATVMDSQFVETSEEVEIETVSISPKDLMEAKMPATPMVVEPMVDGLGKEAMVEEKTSPVVEIAQETAVAEKDVESDSDKEDEEKEENGLSEGQIVRQNRIVEYLKENGSAQVWEILKIFPAVSKRTIRRDFRSMLKQGMIERTGERNTTAYKLKITLS